MKLEKPAGAHLTYCTNIHPGESWPEVRAALDHVVKVKRKVSPSAPFGVGLRLAAQATRELGEPGVLEDARAELEGAGLYVFTLNGFPYGAFHGTRVKERVYRPDWLEEERVQYTSALARVLAQLLPEGVPGSISSVPGCFAERARGADAALVIARNVARIAAELVEIERRSGKIIALALEPEPACLLETTDDTLRFFEDVLFGPASLKAFAAQTGLDAPGAEHALRRHVGVCLDACHASVEFEAPLVALERLRSGGILVPKIQLSAGLRLRAPGTDELEALRAFDDGVYLHQTVVRTPDAAPGELRRFLDLPDALAAAAELGQGSEWRVHFHVPLFEARLGRFSSTQDELRELLLAPELAPHLEVETYTFDVLPAEHRSLPVAECIARELGFVLEVLEERG